MAKREEQTENTTIKHQLLHCTDQMVASSHSFLFLPLLAVYFRRKKHFLSANYRKIIRSRAQKIHSHRIFEQHQSIRSFVPFSLPWNFSLRKWFYGCKEFTSIFFLFFFFLLFLSIWIKFMDSRGKNTTISLWFHMDFMRIYAYLASVFPYIVNASQSERCCENSPEEKKEWTNKNALQRGLIK